MKPNRLFRGTYIQGQFLKVSDPNGEVLSINPGDLEQPPVSFPFSFEHVHEAVAAARRGFVIWKRLPLRERCAVLKRYRDGLAARAVELAAHISFEVGKPFWEARAEVGSTLALIDFFLSHEVETSAEITVENGEESYRGTARFFPRGVMAVITPGNSPCFSAHAHAIPVLAHGNTVVLKSSKHTPMVGQVLAEIFHEAALPAGVVNVIHGDAETARRLVSHNDLDGVFFTGPFETGAKIRKQLVSDYWKLLVLETGGKNAMVVWEDCNYDKALYDALISAYATTGQRCTSASRLLLHENIFDRFLADFHQLSKKCSIGYGLIDSEKCPFMGPLISEAATENYLRYQGIAVREGCEEIMRGKTLERDKRGYYVSPSIHVVTTPNPKSVYQRNEIHGPNVAVFKVTDLEESAEILNHPHHLLTASVYSGARETYLRLVEETHTGVLHWNCPTVEVAYRLPYGGIRKSGNSRPMGSFSGWQCTYPVSSLEHEGPWDPSRLPAQLPRLG